MRKKLFMMAAMMAACLQTDAQTLAKEFKSTSEGNPISGSVFCADPTALEYNGRLYVYGSNDHQQFIANGKKGDNGYGDIKSFVVFSTEDMVNWTFHGTIDVAKICSKWGGNFYRSWAPSVTWRHNEETDKDEFFLYFANWAVNVGVLTADSPLGPWKSPLSNAMISGNTPGVNPCSWCFDPGVVIDENGTGWISFGGGDPNNKGTNFMPYNAGFAKLNSDMISVDGSAIKLPAPYQFEASELNVIGGKYVYTYCSNWASRAETAGEWEAYKAEHGLNMSAPETCTMCYMVSDNPMDPDSWVYKGVYGPHPGTSPNNHSHLQKFKGTYYHIYHNGALLEAMKSENAVDGSAGTYRSISVNKATVNESTQTINKVTLNLEGVEAIGTLNPYKEQQAETMATCGGIEYEDFTNVKKNGRISNLGNDASANMQVKMAEGAWIQLRKVDFGETGAEKFMVRAKGEGTVEVRFSRKTGKVAATINIASDDMQDYEVDVDPNVCNGLKTMFIIAASGTGVYLDSWQATEVGSAGIHEVEGSKVVKTERYDLSGRRLTDGQQHQGIVIEQYTDENGRKQSVKRM
ncbi:MAG: family 43 glycosylhydrolase [Prevotella sp.]|nr:family 43 glycosylhydrolase [Prevotella sp.]